MIQTKYFCANYNDKYCIDSLINEWLEENPDIKVIDIKLCESAGEGYAHSSALVIYQPPKQAEPVTIKTSGGMAYLVKCVSCDDLVTVPVSRGYDSNHTCGSCRRDKDDMD